MLKSKGFSADILHVISSISQAEVAMPAFSLLSYEWQSGPSPPNTMTMQTLTPTRDDLEQVLDISIHLKEEKQMGPAGNPEEEFTPLAPSGRPSGLHLKWFGQA